MSLLLCILLLLLIDLVNLVTVNLKPNMCKPIPEMKLSEILGSAFNSRYMSVSEPGEPDTDLTQTPNAKRSPFALTDFYVGDDFEQELGDQPAWETDHIVSTRRTTNTSRAKRSAVAKQTLQWHCESKIQWMDLGPEYFPRFLRTVECTSKTCWYDMMKCRPRSFTVKLLRRKPGKCVTASAGRTRMGTKGLPAELLELWIWEERAVNFCCDCAL